MSIASDVRLALRSLRRRPAFTLLACAILALGIGANTAMFSVVDAVLIRSLPYRDVDSAVVVFADGHALGLDDRLPTTAGDFLDWREGQHVFSGLAALRNETRRITSLDTPVVPLVHAVTADYFDVLGVRPLLGRTFAPGEDAAGKDDVVILSYGVWQASFGGEPSVVGRKVTLDERPYTVIGVMRPDLWSAHLFAVQPGLWVPSPFESLRNERRNREIMVYGRLRPGQTLAAAQAAMAGVAARLAEQYPSTNARWSVTLVPLREHAVGAFSATGGILMAAVGLVLLIACANVANLTLARASERVQEVAMRTALGASRSRIVAQLLAESLLLSLTGGGLGAALASLGAPALAKLIPTAANVPFLDRVGVDLRVLAFAILVSLASGVLFGLAPARQALRLDLVQVLREGGRGGTGRPTRRLREALVVGEVALAVVVVSAAALLLRSFVSLLGVPPGFDAGRILKLRTSLRGEEFRSPAARIAYFEELQRRLQGLPGVSAVSAVSFEPPPTTTGAGRFAAVALRFPERPDDEASAPSAMQRVVLPDYFETMGIPVRRGRGVLRDDAATGRRVAVISESMARRYFRDVEPIGRRFSLRAPGAMPMEVVGVVGDVVTGGGDPTPQPVFYVPYAQTPFLVMSVVMRVPHGDPSAPAHEAERVAWSLSRSNNVYAIETLDRHVADLNWRARFGAQLLSGFAGLALVLGTAGIYAVVSYTALQRRAEIGVRIALGAKTGDVLGLVLGSGLRLAAVGLFLGTLASASLTRVLTGFLYGVAPGDPATLAAVAGLLLAVATVAGLGPAWRASRVDPQLVLRE